MSSDGLTGVLWLVILAAVGYFLLIRPTRRRAHEVTAIQRALTVGAEVMLSSGIFGTVTRIDDERVEVEVSPGVALSVHRAAIGKVVTPGPTLDDGEGDSSSGDAPVDEADSDADDQSRGAS